MKKRTVAIAIHAALALVIAAWGVWGAYTFWALVFQTPWAAVGALLLIEAFAFAAFVLHVLSVPTPVAAARHLLPVASAAPALHSIHALAKGVGDAEAWLIAVIITLALVLAAYAVWRGLETLLTDSNAVLAAEIAERRLRATATVRRIAAEASAAIEVIGAMQEALEEHERRLLPAPIAFARQTPYPEPMPISAAIEPSGQPASEPRAYACPRCGQSLTLGQYGSAVRRGYCRHCRPAPEARDG